MIRPCEIPADASLRRYRGGGAYADCYVTEVAMPVSQAAFVEAFYTTRLFKVERLLLGWFAGKPSTDRQARQLAAGAADAFAAWRVEGRDDAQLLVRAGRTRSWFMAVPNGDAGTRLYFGSAVVPGDEPSTGKSGLGLLFHALLGFHKLYSRALLLAARARILSSLT